MQSIETNGLEELDNRLSRLIEEAPQARFELQDELGKVLEGSVYASIYSTINERRGRVLGWQKLVKGDKGGYVAMKADKGNVENTEYAKGYVTNAIVSGHVVRPLKRVKVSKRKMVYVSGRNFYEKAGNGIEAKAINACNKFAEKLAGRLGG